MSKKNKQIYVTTKFFRSVFKLVLVLGHGQAAEEKGISVNNKILDVNMNKILIASHKLIIDHMSRPQSFSITFATVIPNHQESVEISEMFSVKIPKVLKIERIVTETKCTICSFSHH